MCKKGTAVSCNTILGHSWLGCSHQLGLFICILRHMFSRFFPINLPMTYPCFHKQCPNFLSFHCILVVLEGFPVHKVLHESMSNLIKSHGISMKSIWNSSEFAPRFQPRGSSACGSSERRFSASEATTSRRSWPERCLDFWMWKI